MITLTAGHSNTDPGAVAKDGTTEAQIVIEMRNLVAAELRRTTKHIVKTDGDGAVNLPLNDAIKLIAGSDIAIELHCNASDNPLATGIEVVALPEGKGVAHSIADAIALVYGSKLRGDKGWIDQSQTHRGRLGYVNAGGYIVELFFISNPADLAKHHAVKIDVAKRIARILNCLARPVA